jgi:hypothetical protein
MLRHPRVLLANIRSEERNLFGNPSFVRLRVTVNATHRLRIVGVPVHAVEDHTAQENERGA